MIEVPEEEEWEVPGSEEEEVVIHARRLDRSECDHQFTQTGDINQDHCVKCGQSVWTWAFMEMP